MIFVQILMSLQESVNARVSVFRLDKSG